MKEQTLKIKQKVSFEFAHERNAQNVALALCSAGYLVRIISSGIGYIVYVYHE